VCDELEQAVTVKQISGRRKLVKPNGNGGRKIKLSHEISYERFCYGRNMRAMLAAAKYGVEMLF
jgi:hypothetical protein